MPNSAGPAREAGTTVRPVALLPAARSYFRYSRSLTTPPCSEGVLWTVFKDPIEASPDKPALCRAVPGQCPAGAVGGSPLSARITLNARPDTANNPKTEPDYERRVQAQEHPGPCAAPPTAGGLGARWKNLKVKTKILLGFGVVLALFAGVSTVSYRSLSGVADGFDNFNRSVEVVGAARTADLAYLEIRRRTARVPLLRPTRRMRRP